jgi:hypothetical protein
MAPVETYRTQVQDLLKQYVEQRPLYDEVETQLVVDTIHDHYQLVNVGWVNKRRVYGCVLHIDIKDDKVWIQHNGTERFVAEDLVALGIPKDRIVLGFHAPFKRQFTEFAVN